MVQIAPEQLLVEYVDELLRDQKPQKTKYLNRCTSIKRPDLSVALNTARLVYAALNSVSLPDATRVEQARQRFENYRKETAQAESIVVAQGQVYRVLGGTVEVEGDDLTIKGAVHIQRVSLTP